MPDALVLDDDRSTLDALAGLLELEGFTTRTASTLKEARRAIEHHKPNVVLSDLVLPDGKGTDLLADLQEQSNIELILITGNATVETAVTALRLGAYDYLTKPVDEARLKSLLTNFKKTRALKRQVSTLRHELRRLGRFGTMVGSSPAMQKVYSMIEKGAPAEATIFLTGESGTGKEMAAATVHQLSRRSQQPFVALNCGAVSANLVESELFGHERGAFTGASRQHQGIFERADQGTLFLDEITEMPIDLQVKLLRVLETDQVTRVGGTRPIDVDVRVIAASNRDPDVSVADGQLREDLLYRLKVFPIHMPPLRQRRSDIELLAEYFLAAVGDDEAPKKTFSRPALDALRRYPWPGNVRELKNVVHRASILADETVTTENLPPEILGGIPAHRPGSGLAMRVGMTIAAAERLLIEATLEDLEGNKKEAAETLGISLKTLYNRLNAYSEEDAANNNGAEAAAETD